MKGTDKFLIGIVAGVVLLVSAAFAVALLRPEATYGPDGTPESAAHNYLLALQKKDYARAYSYLSPTLAGYPATVEEFTQAIEDNDYAFRLNDESTALAVESAHVTGNLATVKVRATRFYNGGLFGSSEYTETFEMHFRLQSGAWKLFNSNSYWAYCWQEASGCR